MVHPFDTVTHAEIRLASKLVKDSHDASDGVHFVGIDRVDPPKQDMLRYIQAEREGLPLPIIPRVLHTYYYTNKTDFNKALVNVTVGHVITKQKQPQGVQGPVLPTDMLYWENLFMKHPAVLAEIEKLKLPAGYEVRADPWIYGTDCVEGSNTPLVQLYVYVLAGNGHSESNHYSLPLKFSPVFECFTEKFIRMDYLPSGYDATTTPTQPWQQVPAVEYHPDLNGEAFLRDVKPLIVSQPEGPSYHIEGGKVKWQGWEFRVAATAREGIALYDARFKGRDVFYRLSLSEMTVPYGDPRGPFHRKQAFDLGDCGFGTNGNQLALGCDCLGVIHYLDGVGIESTGEPYTLGNTICLHEQDNGLLYKHVNYRTQNAVVARKREFVVQTIATVANYEYIVNFKFVNDGGIDIEVRATGILSTMPIDENVTVPWGTIVGPNVMAAYHQHILNFRLDPAIDGNKNTVVYDDTEPLPRDDLNPFGTGYITKRQYVDVAGHIEQSPFTNRSYKIINENVINPVSKTPVGYKINMPAKQMIIADNASYNVRRAKYATQQIWVTKYRDHELFAAGEFTNQGQKDTGLAEWANYTDKVRNEDLVVWATMSFTHVPRVEDFPVMPVETYNIHLTPTNFFDRNPALDLPLATQSFNRSVLYKAAETGAEAGACCKTNL